MGLTSTFRQHIHYLTPTAWELTAIFNIATMYTILKFYYRFIKGINISSILESNGTVEGDKFNYMNTMIYVMMPSLFSTRVEIIF